MSSEGEIMRILKVPSRKSVILGIILTAMVTACSGYSYAETGYSLLQLPANPVASHNSTPIKAPQTTFSLNENGDLVVRCKKGEFILAYAPPEDESVRRRTVIVASAGQECPLINGISIRFHLYF